MASRATPYRVTAWDWAEYFAELERMPESQQVRVTEFVARVLPNDPNAARLPGLKRLHGAQSHLRQFECGTRRLLYEVDDDALEVRIVYLGPHPDWTKRGKVGG